MEGRGGAESTPVNLLELVTYEEQEEEAEEGECVPLEEDEQTEEADDDELEEKSDDSTEFNELRETLSPVVNESK